VTAKLCGRPECPESVFSWLNRRYCTYECASMDRRRREAVLAELESDIDAILAEAWAADVADTPPWWKRFIQGRKAA